ncbi:3-deoxy-manno-octulosonate cytidylyltransferase (CMP-KDO synthetase) [Caballeronia udeis]|uniref:3-deoxy-manno-octulosonate cytidylyltransferase n=1 Tax=Caballeronia udeis TaxID=1232866 RepID=A0ABW8MM83_9BURK
MTSGSDQPRVHVVIPARYGSTRLPAKPLIELAGVPMIVRVYRRVRAALDALDAQTNVIVAIDDSRIADVLDAYNVPALLTGPEHRSGTDRSAEVAERLGWHANDLVVNVQGDEPLLPPALLTAFIAFCNADPQLRMATVAARVTDPAHLHDPNIVKLVVNAAGDAALFSRSPIPYCRDVPADQWPLPAFLRHIGIYAYRRSVIGTLAREPVCQLEQWEKLEQLRAIWLGIPIKVMTWPEAPPHGVDTWDDVKRVSDFLIAGNGAHS